MSTNLNHILNDKIDVEEANETLNEVFTSLDVVFYQLCRTSVINNTNREIFILQELGLKVTVKQKAMDLKMDVERSELFPYENWKYFE